MAPRDCPLAVCGEKMITELDDFYFSAKYTLISVPNVVWYLKH